jgi:hypothetical protein
VCRSSVRQSALVGGVSHGSRAGRPYRRLRRWARHTPNGAMALNMISLGIALILIAAIIAFVFF